MAKDITFDILARDRASGVLDAAGSKIEGFGTKLGRLATLSTHLGAAGGEVGEIIDKVGGIAEAAGAAHGRLGKAMAGTGAAAATAGVALMTLGSGPVEASNQLEAAVAATGRGYGDFGDQVDALVGKQTKYGNTDVEVKNSLQKLTTAYGDPKKALEQMGLVTDLAAAKHISLADAAGMVAKAHGGAGRIFKEFGIVVGLNKDGTKDYDGALTTLSTKVSGQATAAQDSFSGKMRAVKADVENAAGAFGEKYGPALTGAGAVVSTLGMLSETTAGKTVILKVAQLAGAVASGVQSAAQWALNAAMDANPIGLVIVALAALAAGIVWVATKTTWFQTIWEYTSGAIGKVWQFLWNNILAPVIRFILNGFANLASAIGSFLQTLGNIPGFGWAKTAGDAMQSAADKARNLAQGITDIPDHKNISIAMTVSQAIQSAIPGMGSSAPAHASGGRNLKAGWSLVGEEGPELMFVPNGADIYSNPESKAMATPTTQPGGGPSTFHIYDADGALLGSLKALIRGENTAQARAVAAGVW